MLSKLFCIKFFLMFLISMLILSSDDFVQARNNLTKPLDIVVKISKLNESLDTLADLTRTASGTNSPQPTDMLRGMLQGTDWIDRNRTIIIGIILNETKPEIGALIPFETPNNNFKTSFNAFQGPDYYIIAVPPVPGGESSEALKKALITGSDLKSGDSISITMNVNKIMEIYDDKIKEFMAQLENMPPNQDLNNLNMTPRDIRSMFEKILDTLLQTEIISTGFNFNESMFQTFFQADTVQNSELEKLFASTGDTVLLGNYIPRYQINFRSHSYDVSAGINLLQNCFGSFYEKIGLNLLSLTAIYANFTGEMAGGINFDNGKIVCETISVLKKGPDYTDFIEADYFPWLEKYSKDVNQIFGMQTPANQKQFFIRTPESVVKGQKVYGIKMSAPFLPAPEGIKGVTQKRRMLEYNMRMTVLDNLFIIAPHDQRIGELITISRAFKEKKSVTPLITMDVDLAGYLKMMMEILPAQEGIQIGEIPSMGKINIECDTKNGTISSTLSIMMDDIKNMIAWGKTIDFANIHFAKDHRETGVKKAEPSGVPQLNNQAQRNILTEDDAQYWWEKGNICATYGNNKTAIKYYKKTIAIDPHKIDAYFQLGVAYGETGAYRQAIASINKALQAAPRNSLYLYGRGRVLLLLGDEQKGLDDLKLSAELGNHDAINYFKNKLVPYS